MAQKTPQQVLQTVWTIPNLISLLRLITLLPLTVALLLQHRFIAAFVALIVLGLTDWLDGFVARRFGQVSEFGKNLDPIADRVSVIAVVCALTAIGAIPWQFVAAIAGVDVILALTTMIWFRGAPGIEVSRIGKLRTAVVLVALPTLILAQALDLAWVDYLGVSLLVVGVVGHVAAGVGYLRAMYLVRSA